MAVFGAFLVPFLHLPSDDAWIPAIATRTQQVATDFFRQAFVPHGNRTARRFVQVALQYP